MKLLNLTEKTNVVIHAMALITNSDDNSPVSVKTIATHLNVSETYLAKVLQPIVKEGFLNSSRGAKGGFTMKKNPEEIMVLDLLTLLEGPLPENNCLFNHPVCERGDCPFSNLSQKIRTTIMEELKGISIKDVSESFAKNS